MPIVSRSNCVKPLSPVPWTGRRIGQTQRQPAKEIVPRSLTYLRKKKPSRDDWLRTTASGSKKNGLIQLNQPEGRVGLTILAYAH